MRNKKWVLLGCNTLVVLCSAGVRGDVTITSRYSEATAFAKAFGSSAFGEADGPTVSRTSTSNDFAAFNAQRNASSASTFSTTSDSSAFQDSSLTLIGSSLVSAHVFGDTSADASTSIGQGIASGLSEFDIDFTVSGTPSPYLITGGMMTNLPNSISLTLFNVATPGSPIEFIRDTDPGAASYMRSGTLPLGNYRLEMVDFNNVNVTSGTTTRTGSFSMDFAATPEPTSALLAIGGAFVLGARRRRSVA